MVVMYPRVPCRCGVGVEGQSGAIAVAIVDGDRAVGVHIDGWEVVYHPRSASTDAGRAIGVPASTDVDIAIVALTSGDAGISHELEVACAADLVPASIDAGIAHEREIALAADLVADCSPWMSPVKDAFRSVEHRGQKRRGPQPGR